MGTNADPVAVLEKRVFIAAGERRLDAGLKLFTQLCETPTATPEQILAAFHRFDAIAHPQMRRLLAELIVKPGMPSIIGTIWALNRTGHGQWWIARRVNRLRLEHPVPGEAAVIGYIQSLGEIFSRNPRDLRRICLNYILRKNRDWLKNNDWGWGMVGYALSSAQLHGDVVNWLADYSDRKGLEPWMIHNYIEASHRLGLDEPARDATEHALKLPVYGDAMNGPLVWGAIEAALAGDCATARDRLGRIHTRTLSGQEQTVRDAANLIIEFQEAAPGQRKYGNADRKIMSALSASHPANKWIGNVRNRFFRLLREKHGDRWSGWLAWLSI
jgi:hypothetical protein